MGSDNKYKSYIGPIDKYDLVASMQFTLLTSLELRENNTLLDIGCGSLRAGKLFIPYLQKGNYFGIEPNKWLVDEGLDNELGRDIMKIKNPTFYFGSDFRATVFNMKFDYVIAQSIFSHATKEQIEICVKEVGRALEGNGIFAFTFILGKSDYDGHEWVYPDCVTYTQKYIREKFASGGMAVEKTGWHHPNGQTWFIGTHMSEKSILKEKKLNLFDFHKTRKRDIGQYLRESRLNNRITKKMYHFFKWW